VSFWISGEAQGVLNFTQPTRIRLVGNANWALLGRDTKATRLAEGNERVIDGFDIFDTEYFAMDLNNEQVQRRIAEEMADRITLRLAAWLHQHPTAMG
jgi:LPS-assembly lipoprotein